MPTGSQRAIAGPFAERRHSVRCPVKTLAYIDLSGDNGGIVLNVSEGGVGVRTAMALDARTFPCLQFQLPHSREWIRARGAVAWTSETGKNAGIRFTELPEAARAQIREWMVKNAGHEGGPVSLPKERGGLAVMPTRTGSHPVESPLRELQAEASRRNEVLVEEDLRSACRKAAVPSAAVKLRRWGRLLATAAALVVLAFVGGFAAGHRWAAVNDGPGASAEGEALAAPAAAASPMEVSAAISAAESKATRITVTSQILVPVSATQGQSGGQNTSQVGRILHRVDPAYPSGAIAEGIEGTVQLRASIDAGGAVQEVSALNGPALLIQPAIDAVRRWRFAPTVLDGKAVGTRAEIAIVFWLPPNSGRGTAKE